MKHLVFLVEEPSAKDLLAGFLRRFVPEAVEIHYLVFDGKQDLERNLVRKLQGWLKPESAFVVLRDQDAADCVEVKRALTDLVQRSVRSGVLVRVACRELEAWCLGDWQAVASAFDRPEVAAQAHKAIYRDPDRLARPVDEFRKFLPDYQKRHGAKRIGPLLDPGRNRSRSFQAFYSGIRKLLESTS